MGKLRYLTVIQYAEVWEKTPQTIYLRISSGKLLTIPEPDGGRGKLIPVCDCVDNYFPNRTLCNACKKELEASQSEISL